MPPRRSLTLLHETAHLPVMHLDWGPRPWDLVRALRFCKCDTQRRRQAGQGVVLYSDRPVWSEQSREPVVSGRPGAGGRHRQLCDSSAELTTLTLLVPRAPSYEFNIAARWMRIRGVCSFIRPRVGASPGWH